MKIAIVGSGISGLACAHLLKKDHEITLFEAAAKAGGHVNTVEVTGKTGTFQVDTGFIVFNEQNYPNFVRLLDLLGVESQDTRMGFFRPLGATRPRVQWGILSGPVRSPPKPDRLAPLENGFGHRALSQTCRGEDQRESNGRSIFENPRVRKSFQGMLPPSFGGRPLVLFDYEVRRISHGVRNELFGKPQYAPGRRPARIC